jgi:DNA polymerase III subunit alpha
MGRNGNCCFHKTKYDTGYTNVKYLFSTDSIISSLLYTPRPMNPSFVHLRLHTEYSLIDGLITIDELMQRAVDLQMPALAVSDHVNLFATVKFYKAALATGIKPIIGADCWIANPQQVKQPFRCTLLCQNDAGYKNLTRLITRAYREGQTHGFPIIEKEWLINNSYGLIALSGAREGDIGCALLANKKDIAAQLLTQWQALFPDRFYLELQRTGRANEESYIQVAIELAQTSNTPVVATNDVRFLSGGDFEAHEARVCIHNGSVLADPKRAKLYSPQQYLRSMEEMQKLFADIPEALANTVEIAKRCNLELVLGKTSLPNFPIPAGMTAESYLTQQAEQGLKERWRSRSVIPAQAGIQKTNNNELDSRVRGNDNLTKNGNDDFNEQIYFDRLKIELDVINPMGFAGYFLIVADFIRWAKENKIPVGPGRGSGAGSLVAYALRITDLDPIQYDLLFERFLNPERVSMPDFDIDFCMEGRDRVIEYVAERYGRNAVSQIITFGTMAARAVVRDVGRVLSHPYGMVDKLAKLIPFELGITLDKALAQEEELKRRYNEEEEVKLLIDLARKLEGLARNAGKHAGGVVIAPSELTDFTALYCEAGESNGVTQFDKDDIDTVGLVKFDFLGLRTLTIMDWALQTINKKRTQNNEPSLKIDELPLDDAKTFALLKTGATTAVFQLESRGMKDLVKRLQPEHFEDIVPLVALFRPGPLQSGMTDDFINRKHGQAQINYFHPLLEPVLKPTYGIILYQEQVMQIAQVLAGYTLGGADILRRAMGKKKASEMAHQRTIFLTGAIARGVDKKLAETIFDLMEKFADYGFNKSHSAAYALVSYQTAWLKTHYPAEFMAAVLSSDMDHTDKVIHFLGECRAMKLNILPPNINCGQYKFTVNEQGEIIYGLGAIKGAGEAALSLILATRDRDGAFKDLFDLCTRVDTGKVNRRVMEALIRSGSLDTFGMNRASLMATLDVALQSAEQALHNTQHGQHDLFGDSIAPQQHQIEIAEWAMEKILEGEKETLGFYLSSHPLQRYEKELNQFITSKLAELNTDRKQSIIIAGWSTAIKTIITKRGDRMAVVTLEDDTGRLEITLFSEAYNNYRHLLNKDQLLIVEGEVSIDEYSGNNRLLARRVLGITQARELFAQRLLFKINSNLTDQTLFDQLRQIILPFCPGKLPIFIEYKNSDAKAQLSLGANWQVQPSDELLQNVQKLLGDNTVEITYANDKS